MVSRREGVAVCKEIPAGKRAELVTAYEQFLAKAAGPSGSSGLASEAGVSHKQIVWRVCGGLPVCV